MQQVQIKITLQRSAVQHKLDAALLFSYSLISFYLSLCCMLIVSHHPSLSLSVSLSLSLSLSVSSSQGACRFSTESSQRRCRTPDGKICGGRGDCECGVCVCKASEPGKFFGPRCECLDWLCATHNGKACNGACDNDVMIHTHTHTHTLTRRHRSSKGATRSKHVQVLLFCLPWHSSTETKNG